MRPPSRQKNNKANGKYEFTDPAFEIWFKKQYFNRPDTAK